LIPGKSLEEALFIVNNEEIETVVILENDLYRRAPEKDVDNLFLRSSNVIVLDHLENKTSLKADILLPAATFAESEGTLVNNESRAQRFYKAISNKDEIKESWRWMNEFIQIRDLSLSYPDKPFNDTILSLIKEFPVFSKLKDYMPSSDFRMLNTKIPRQTIRYSGRTAMNANLAVNELKVAQDDESPLSFSMEGQPEKPPSSLVPFYWSPGWNSVHAIHSYLDKPNGSMLGGDPGIRLFEQINGSGLPYFEKNAETIKIQNDELTIVPVYHIFGSEELSSVASSIAGFIKEPFIFLNQEDADKSGFKEGDLVQLEISNIKTKTKVKIENSLVQGLAGLSVNLPGMQFFNLPGNGRLNKL
jgi:NADH-quinone oxidoreductase subunit G